MTFAAAPRNAEHWEHRSSTAANFPVKTSYHVLAKQHPLGRLSSWKLIKVIHACIPTGFIPASKCYACVFMPQIRAFCLFVTQSDYHSEPLPTLGASSKQGRKWRHQTDEALILDFLRYGLQIRTGIQWSAKGFFPRWLCH